MEHGLEYKPANVWDTFADPEKKLEISSFAADYISFLSQCKTEREVAAWIEKQLLEYGFTPAEDGPITEQRTFRVIGNKTVLAFFGGRRTLSDGVRLIAAHGDSPRLDLKQRPLFEEHNVAMFRTHYYGGIRKHQWLSIPLALHGVVIKKDGTRVDIAIGESPDEPVLTIADLLPHLAYKQVEQRLSEAFEAEKLCVIVGHAPEDRKKSDSDSDEEKKPKDNARIKCAVLKILNERFGIDETDLISAELQAVPAGPARFVGLDESLIGGYGQDDRACVFTALRAFLTLKEPDYPAVLVIWDKEEIGSEGFTGAKAQALELFMEDLARGQLGETSPRRIFARTLALSADVTPAFDPLYPEVHEKQNAAFLGFGPVFNKFTGHRGKAGANDANPEYLAWIRNILDKAGIPWQIAETGKIDLGGGGTVAKYMAERGMNVIDFGPALLGTHSPFEIASKADIWATFAAYRAFFTG